jgi:hypothetical protein
MEPRERLRFVLKYRAEAAGYYDLARELGPQVFIDTFPSALNSLVVVFLGSVLLQDPGTKTPAVGLPCDTDASIIRYLTGVLVSSYLLLACLAFFLFRRQVSTHIRWPFLAVLAWMVAVCLWAAIIGYPAVIAGATGCYAIAPWLYVFAAVQLVAGPLFAVIWIVHYGLTLVAFAIAVFAEIGLGCLSVGQACKARCCDKRKPDKRKVVVGPRRTSQDSQPRMGGTPVGTPGEGSLPPSVAGSAASSRVGSAAPRPKSGRAV